MPFPSARCFCCNTRFKWRQIGVIYTGSEACGICPAGQAWADAYNFDTGSGGGPPIAWGTRLIGTFSDSSGATPDSTTVSSDAVFYDLEGMHAGDHNRGAAGNTGLDGTGWNLCGGMTLRSQFEFQAPVTLFAIAVAPYTIPTPPDTFNYLYQPSFMWAATFDVDASPSHPIVVDLSIPDNAFAGSGFCTTDAGLCAVGSTLYSTSGAIFMPGYTSLADYISLFSDRSFGPSWNAANTDYSALVTLSDPP